MSAFNLRYLKNSWTRDLNDHCLFHFTSEEKYNCIMKSKSLRFTKNNFSNDPEDGKYIGTLTESLRIVEEGVLPEEKKFWKPFECIVRSFAELQDQWLTRQSVNSIIRFSTYVLSFSLNKEEKQLWYRYADKYKGKCLEFSRDRIDYWLENYTEYSRKYEVAFSAKVIYKKSEQLEILSSILTNAYFDYLAYFESDKDRAKEVLEDIHFDLFACSYFFKDELKWAKEEEFRIILLHSYKNQKPENTSSGVPYIEIPFLSPEDNSDFFNNMAYKRSYDYAM